MHNNTRSLVRSQSGFTIIETLIVIAVSAAMLMSAIMLVAGQQRKVEFTQSAQDIRSVIEQVIAETSSGYYPNNGNFSCTATASNITIESPPTAAQGSSDRCIFLGRAMQFGNSGNKEAYIVHTIVGYQDNDSSISQAIPEAVDLDSARTYGQMRNGVSVVAMRYTNGATSQPIAAFAFMQGLGDVDASNQILSGSQQVSLHPLDATFTNVNQFTNIPTVVNSINQLDDTSPVNPSGGVQICLASGGTQQWAQITIGSNGRSLSVKLDYKNAVCW
jgi:prepilin-type N-terminal cleavage/methylation domain-containing protein